ncbi:hypothetical protein ElyMa_002831100 [Elysia marginata]|uniref:G-protein coupled receptors family 1 profile domain-containing protein n=1 Tax=Elysia marginata TaxID=1093978 RepID=A0AAV4HSN1_9GAST|nr:hypothetical protein ElyMa_002831100 [Elysia marginata]
MLTTFFSFIHKHGSETFRPSSNAIIGIVGQQNTNLFISLVSILFFFPIALCAIYKATQAEEFIKNGDSDRSTQASNCAKSLALAAICTGFLGWSIALLVNTSYLILSTTPKPASFHTVISGSQNKTIQI